MAQTTVNENEKLIPFGDFNRWMVRVIDESFVIGGNTKILYEVAPLDTIRGDANLYRFHGLPWRTSNVMAKVSGITKCSISVFPEKRDDGYCVRVETLMEKCKVLGIVNITVLVPGTIYLGQMHEPIKDTKNPQSKLNAGLSFTETPKAVVFDYKMETPGTDHRIKATGFSKIVDVPGRDSAEIYVIFQKRWEDENGNVYAKRIGTAIERLSENTPDWKDGHRLDVIYGNPAIQPGSTSYMQLIPKEQSLYCINSKGKSVPVEEIGWGDANDKPTHLFLRVSSSYGEAYIGTIGNKLWIDNVRLAY
ncbi:MAG: PCMD domain-containing protein [Butyricimonas faecalis]